MYELHQRLDTTVVKRKMFIYSKMKIYITQSKNSKLHLLLKKKMHNDFDMDINSFSFNIQNLINLLRFMVNLITNKTRSNRIGYNLKMV